MSGEAGASSVTVRSQGLSWQEVDDEIVILDLESSRYLSLNGSAGLLWRTLTQGPTDVDRLTDRLLETFSVDRQQARSDTTAFVAQCAALGLLA